MTALDHEWVKTDAGTIRRIDYVGGGIEIEDMGGKVYRVRGLHKLRGKWRRYETMMGIRKIRTLMTASGAPEEMIP